MKIRSRLPLLVGTFLLAGCNDMLTETPDAVLTAETFFRTPADADAAMVGVYAPLLTAPGFYRDLWMALEAAPDQGMIGPSEQNAQVRATGTLQWTSTHPRVTTPWTPLYQVVTRANLVIDKVPQIQMPAARTAQVVGEAKFLRALAYFYLVRLYGDVPLLTDPNQPGATAARAPKAEVYGQIIEDAQAAARDLPINRDAGNIGRATRGAALALLADVHLTRGEWEAASTRAKQVIDLGVYSLIPDYSAVFLPANKNGAEDIFSLQAYGPVAPNTMFANLYYPRQLGIGTGGGREFIIPTPAHYASYPELKDAAGRVVATDYRKDATYATQGTNSAGRIIRFDPRVFKYRPTNPAQLNNGDVNVPIYRYAEVLLFYAEAQNELGNAAEAVRYLNQIRARARRASGTPRLVPADYAGPVTKEALREAIFEERNIELAHEAKRWFDLVRRGPDYFLQKLGTDP